MNTLTYVYDNKIYLNLTNKCSNNCEFCIRHTGDGVLDYYLWLDKEPTADEVIEDLKKYMTLTPDEEAGVLRFRRAAVRFRRVAESCKMAQRTRYENPS